MRNWIIAQNRRWDRVQEPTRFILFMCFAVPWACVLSFNQPAGFFIAIVAITFRLLGGRFSG